VQVDMQKGGTLMMRRAHSTVSHIRKQEASKGASKGWDKFTSQKAYLLKLVNRRGV